MRKDRHKKQHHRQYKSGDGKRSATKTDHRHDRENRKDSEESRSFHHAVAEPTSQASKVDSEKPGGISNQDKETSIQSAFSRRKVESNWDRYQELPDDDDKPEVRGTDFTILLNQAGAASSQLRLHDEKDWEDETERFQLTGNVLSLDINTLSTALMQLPIHTRLQIEPDIFQVDLQDQDEAQSKEVTLLEKLSASRTSPPQLHTATKDTRENVKENAPQSDELSDNFRNDSEKIIVTPKISELGEKEKEQLKAEISETVKSDTAIKVKETVNIDVESDEDELEFLLCLDTPQSAQPTHQQQEVQPLPIENPDLQENPTEEEAKESTSSSKEPVKTISEPTSDELEDWLDSVLDD